MNLDAVLEWSYSPAPEEVRRKARLLVLDTLGCALAALDDPTVSALGRVSGDAGRLEIARTGARLSPLAATAFLATAACWDEACEGLARAHGRPGVPVIAACVCLGLQQNVTLGKLLDAVVTGYEIGGRMGERLRIRPGMHVDASWPSLGAAAAVSRLLGATPAVARDAVEIAASQIPFSLYLPVEQGANARNTYLGHAAWLGAYSALAARSGCAAPRGAVDRFAATALNLDASAALAETGQHFILEAYLKPFAAVRHVHYGAEAALRLRPGVRDTKEIHRIELAVYPEALHYCGNRAPRTAIQAQFSLSFGVAAALRLGHLGPEAYRQPQFEDVELRRLEALVSLSADESLGSRGRRSATLALHTAQGRMEERVDAVKGDRDLPFTERECGDKFERNAMRAIGSPPAGNLAADMLSVAETTALRTLLAPAIGYQK